MPEPDRSMAQRIHELVTEAVPDLVPRTYYGMPAWAKDGKTICFFKPKSKFKERNSTFGFEQHARLDDGDMWPVAFNIAELTPAGEQQIARLVKKAAGRPLTSDWAAIEIRGASENNLRDVSLDVPKRRLTVFTGVSGSGKSSLVFHTLAAESRRLINETYTAFLQTCMGTPARPDVASLANLFPAIV